MFVIHLTEREPPVGTVEVSGRNPVAFVGWLGLMSVLADLLDVAASEPESALGALPSAPNIGHLTDVSTES